MYEPAYIFHIDVHLQNITDIAVTMIEFKTGGIYMS